MEAAFAATRKILEQRLAIKPDDPRTIAVLAQVDAGLGKKEQALAEGRRAVDLMPLSRDAYDGMIAAVQAQFPGLLMRRTSPIDGHRDLVRFTWALGAPGEAPMFAGLDVAKTDDDGKLHRIIGFAGETVPAA
jgi:hypothetical protein